MMDGDRFDTLSRHLGTLDTRRGLLRLLGGLPLAGALASIRAEEGAAERPHERLGRRTQQRNRKQRNNQNRTRNGNNGGGGNGGDGGNGGGWRWR